MKTIAEQFEKMTRNGQWVEDSVMMDWLIENADEILRALTVHDRLMRQFKTGEADDLPGVVYEERIAALEQKVTKRNTRIRNLLRQIEKKQERIAALESHLSHDQHGWEQDRKRIAALEQERDRLREHINDLQSGMYINCVYCGHRYGPDPGTPVAMADVLKEHIGRCPEHPMSALKQERDRLRDALKTLCMTTNDKGEPTCWDDRHLRQRQTVGQAALGVAGPCTDPECAAIARIWRGEGD